LDVDEGLFGGMNAGGDGLRDFDGGRGVALEGEEGLAHGDLDLVLAPRDDLVVATNDAQGGLRGGVAIDGNLACAIQEEALGDEVGVVVDEGFLEEFVEPVEGEPDGRLGAAQPGKIGGDLPTDGANPAAVGVGEYLLLTAGEVD